ncbi:LysE family translocator [Amycolatopsis sp. cmx-11-12]|uniref:LysE family translocator n=1 Tax=Amycolatopsis sp. cmx-11-12 TaxID=2785795 RepID=UPI0039185E03
MQMIRRRNTSHSDLTAHSGEMANRRAYVTGLLTNLLNPKVVAFTVAFLPQFINPHLGNVATQFMILGAILITLEFLVDGTVGLLVGRIGRWLHFRRNARKRIDTATGGIFIGLGVRLALHP